MAAAPPPEKKDVEMNKTPILLVTACAILAVLMPVGKASAHHSFAMFDQNKEVALQGTIKRFTWSNPHVFIDLLVPDSSGQDALWQIECPSVTVSSHFGWTREVMKSGDKVSITVHPLRDGMRGGSILTAILPSGQLLKIPDAKSIGLQPKPVQP
jgi:Family of unknown function (DUF6152)